jgi:pyruvate dehydrogenase E1 component alpha subunit
MGAHTTADDPTKYREDDEVAIWRARDPLRRVQAYLAGRGQWSEDWEHELLESCTAVVEAAMNEAEAVPEPPPQDMFRYMYADMTPALQEQEALLLSRLQKKD